MLGNLEAAMRSVDLYFTSAEFGESLGDMRQWLDHNDCTPTNFRTKAEQPGMVLVHVEFDENDASASFERHFAEHLIIPPSRVNSVSADPLEKVVEAA
jgi:hypothetical protein